MNCLSFKFLLCILILFFFSNCLIDQANLEDIPTTQILVEYKGNNRVRKSIGENGILYFTTSYNDGIENIFDESDIETISSFQTLFQDMRYTQDKFNITCNLWKPKNQDLMLFCKLNKTLSTGTHQYLINTGSFNYNGRNFQIQFYTYSNYQLEQIDEKLPFLYSNGQTINIEEGKETYYLYLKLMNIIMKHCL